MASAADCKDHELRLKIDTWCNLFIIGMITYLLMLNESLRLPQGLNRCCVLLGIVSCTVGCTVKMYDAIDECVEIAQCHSGYSLTSF